MLPAVDSRPQTLPPLLLLRDVADLLTTNEWEGGGGQTNAAAATSGIRLA